MYERDLRKQPTNILGHKFHAYTHPKPEVKKLMTLISNMVMFTPANRVDALKVLTEVEDVHKAG